MAQFLPVILSGGNLGDRHRYLNSQVNQVANNLSSFLHISDLPEQTPIDRLFKIDLAVKLNNIDYILKNIKHDDMLYVSRALKSKWLLERRDVINPKYLEDVLYPEMVMPAISKMKHWLYINLRDPLMCREFYQYYKHTKFDYAMKFLYHCDNEFVSNEFSNILIKITPHYLKVLGEKCPELVKVYFDSLATNDELVKRYLKDEQEFFKNIKFILKSRPDIFLDIIEKYHTLRPSNRLSPSATDFIMRFHKNRFLSKPELYVAFLLHIPTVARILSSEECQDVVLKLARADFVSGWFCYANVEPLIKCVSPENRAKFKKRVFVMKDIGERVKRCPYVLPSSPKTNDNSSGKQYNIFYDRNFEPIQILLSYRFLKLEYLCDRCSDSRPLALAMSTILCPIQSELQKLFDEFRYVGFEGTLHELRERIRATSSADRRRDMLLVLVSKSGGRADAVRALLQLALSLRNEPVHERAAVIRSLVKRASAWRFPQDVWNTMLEYAHGLGLDGSQPEAECFEGLHAVVLRQLLDTGYCELAVRYTFLKEFSTLAEYKLMMDERVKIAAGLQQILVTAAAEEDPKGAAKRINQLLDVIENHYLCIKSSSVVSMVTTLAKRDSEAARPLLMRLYNTGIGRRELLREYLSFKHDNAALLNVLRHDPDAITPEWVVKLLADDKTKANHFFLKLSVYFNEIGGISEKIQHLLQEVVTEKPDVKLARPLATLAGSDMILLWRKQDEAGGEHYKLAAALRANMHCARPAPDALVLGWRNAGMKAVAWRAMRCRPAQVTLLARTLLEERTKRTVRVALMLAQRTDCMADLFSTAVTIRPLATLRAALLYYRKIGESADPTIWNTVKSILLNVDLNRCQGLSSLLSNIGYIPDVTKPDFCALLYLALSKICNGNRHIVRVLKNLIKYLPQVSEDLLDNVLLKILEDIDKENAVSYPAIVIRYLMLSKSDTELQIRLEKVGHVFLDKLFAYLDHVDEARFDFFVQNVKQIASSMQYHFAFFDLKYQSCLSVIEWAVNWMQKFLEKEKYFGDYVKTDAIVLYYKAIRHIMAQNDKIFKNPQNKMSEVIEIVGFKFGKYIAKEVINLKSKYFPSIIQIYSEAFVGYLNEYIIYGIREDFIAAFIKGVLSENAGSEARLAIHILRYQHSLDKKEFKELIMNCEDKETQFFLYAEILA